MPDRFKVSKADASDIDATYHSILKDKDEEAAAVLGKLLPPSNNIDSCNKKGMFIFTLFFSRCLFRKYLLYHSEAPKSYAFVESHISLHFAGCQRFFQTTKYPAHALILNKKPHRYLHNNKTPHLNSTQTDEWTFIFVLNHQKRATTTKNTRRKYFFIPKYVQHRIITRQPKIRMLHEYTHLFCIATTV